MSAVARPAQGSSGVRVCAALFVNLDLPVDQNVLDSFRVLVRLLERRAVAHRARVEDCYVGERARAQDAPVAKSHTRRGHPGQRVHGPFEREQVLVADVAREYSRVRTPAARVRLRACERPVSRARAAVRADADERSTQRRAQIVLAHHEVDRAGLPAVCENQIEQSVQLVLALLLRYLGDALALQVLNVAVDDRADEHARRAAASQVDVLPLARVLEYVLFNFLPRRRVAQAREHLLRPDFERPRREARGQGCARGGVRVNVRRDVETARAGRVYLGDDFGHAPPVLSVGGLEVPDFGGYASAARDLEDLGERGVERVRLAALVRHVYSPVRPRGPPGVPNLVRLPEAAGHVLKGS